MVLSKKELNKIGYSKFQNLQDSDVKTIEENLGQVWKLLTVFTICKGSSVLKRCVPFKIPM